VKTSDVVGHTESQAYRQRLTRTDRQRDRRTGGRYVLIYNSQ